MSRIPPSTFWALIVALAFIVAWLWLLWRAMETVGR